MSPTAADVVVIGGGIVGTAAAAFLAEAGARVTLVERDGLASGASGANSGVVQHPFDPVLARTLSRDARAVPATSPRPTSASASARSRPACSTCPPTKRLSGMSTGRLPTRFRPSTGSWPRATRCARSSLPSAPGLWGCRVGIGYPVAPAASTYAYATIAERRGVGVRMGRTAALDRRGDAVVGVVVDGERTPADAVLVAAGPWSPSAHRPDRGLATDPRTLGRRRRDGAADRPDPRPRGGRDRRRDRHAERAARADETDLVDFSLVPFDGVAVGRVDLPRPPAGSRWRGWNGS